MTLANRGYYEEEYLEALRRSHRFQAARRRREVERGARLDGARRRTLELDAEIASCRQELALVARSVAQELGLDASRIRHLRDASHLAYSPQAATTKGASSPRLVRYFDNVSIRVRRSPA